MKESKRITVVEVDFMKEIKVIEENLGWSKNVDVEKRRLAKLAILDEIIKERIQNMEDAHDSYKNVMSRFSPVLNKFYEKWDPIIALYCKELAEMHEENCKDTESKA